MRFGRDQPAFLKPEDNGGFEQVDGEDGGSVDEDVIYDILPPETEKKNSTKVKN